MGILDLAKTRTILLDGGMGTELMKRGLTQGQIPELWNVEHPEAVQSVHRDYFEAGADAVSTNSFGASRLKLEGLGLAERCRELNRAAAANAAAVRPAGRFVAGSVGPTGKFLKPQGEYTEGQIEESFAEQAAGLAEGGADFPHPRDVLRLARSPVRRMGGEERGAAAARFRDAYLQPDQARLLHPDG